ncbi:hypothetical protein HS088_TW13G01254 [Tripterygium wilfordii]|uniref:E3 ubiquitin-protein ligase RMA n=1 Tax=Tripterygium wilfordii TaxID=458696 RepID=A0A7J7CWU1_TRIWF|nr:uncharacterized protein LOC120013687 isoform X2 [Tripterygium wilfordii]KAF5738356.1 hypothetical protein HS088_TW13G01254 [Tripterygium wilfordii]
MDLDLNQEPLEPSHGSMLGLGSLINDLETAHGRIEERIRRLEAVTSRARWHQRWRHPQSTDQEVDISVVSAAPEVQDGNGPITAEDSVSVHERMVPYGRNGKQYGNTFLIARALATDMDDRKAANDRDGFFDCHICLDIPKDPILTCCGHLFCWPCFYQLPYAYSNVKECPACNGEVTDTGITPIYGNGNGDGTSSSKLEESGLIVPPRPRANRTETLRQQLLNRGTFSAPVEVTVVRENIVDAVQERIHQQEDLNGHVPEERSNILSSQSHASQMLPAIAIEGNQRHRSLQASRLLLQGAASLSSALNSATDSAERLVEDLEAYINTHGRRRHRRRLHVDTDSLSHIISVGQPGNGTHETAEEIDSTVPPSASYMSSPEAAATAAHIIVDNHATNTVEINGSAAMSSSSRIQTDMSTASDSEDTMRISSNYAPSSSRRRTEVGLSDVDGGFSYEPRRRRIE